MKYLKKYNESNYRSISDLKDLIYDKLRELKEDIDDGFNIQINDKPYTLNHIDGVEREFVKCKVMKESHFDYSQISETIEGLKKMMEIEGWSLWDYSCYLGHRPPTAKIERELNRVYNRFGDGRYTESCYSFNITFVKGDNLDSPYAYMMGMKRYQLKTNEELFASTYKSAADILMTKGHRKRAAELMKMHDFRKAEEEQEKLHQEEMRKNKIIQNAAQLGVYKCKVRFSKEEFIGDFYLNLTFAEYLFDDDYPYFLDGESGMYLGFAIGVIPANEESKEWIEKVGKGYMGGDKVTYWMGDLRLKASNVQNVYHMGDFTEPPTSGDVHDDIYESGIDDEEVIIYYNSNTKKRYRFDKENDKWISHYLEFAPDGNMFFEIHEGDFYLADRKSAVQFKSKFYDIFAGKIIFKPDPNLDHVKDMMLECICNEYGHSIQEFIDVMESIKKVRINALYKD